MTTKSPLLSALALGAWLTFAQPAAAQFTFLNVGHTNDSNGGANIFAVGVAVSGNTACLAMYSGGLYIYDVSDPAHPVNVARTNNGGYTRGVAMAGQYAYVCGDTGLRIYDLADPAHPVWLGQTNHLGDAYGVYVVGDYAYTVGEYQGVRLYKVSDPAHPEYLSQVSGPTVYDAAIRDNYLYVAGNFGPPPLHSLRVYELTNPASPILVGRSTNQFYPEAIALSGNYAILASMMSPGGLLVCDISDPQNPFTVAHTDSFFGSLNTVFVSGNYAFTSGSFPQMFDISDPLMPFEVGQISSVRYTLSDIEVVGNYLYAATGADGLRTYLVFPQLAIANTSTNTVALSWPSPPAPGFSLQSNPTLDPGTWSEVTNAPVVISNRNLIVHPASAASQFYRLTFP